MSAGMPNSATGLGGRSDSRSGMAELAVGDSTLAMLKLSECSMLRSDCRDQQADVSDAARC